MKALFTFLLLLATPASAEIPGDCCVFPLRQRSLEPVDEQGYRYGTFNRYISQLHHLSGNLLAASSGSEVLSVSEGIVIRGPYFFYQGVMAVEIQNAAGPVVRYALLDSKEAPGIHQGAKVAKGQVVGYVGRPSFWNANEGLYPQYSVVLFEMYMGTGNGPLSQADARNGIMPRRSDIIDPTDFLKALEPK